MRFLYAILLSVCPDATTAQMTPESIIIHKLKTLFHEGYSDWEKPQEVIIEYNMAIKKRENLFDINDSVKLTLFSALCQYSREHYSLDNTCHQILEDQTEAEEFLEYLYRILISELERVNNNENETPYSLSNYQNFDRNASLTKSLKVEDFQDASSNQSFKFEDFQDAPLTQSLHQKGSTFQSLNSENFPSNQDLQFSNNDDLSMSRSTYSDDMNAVFIPVESIDDRYEDLEKRLQHYDSSISDEELKSITFETLYKNYLQMLKVDNVISLNPGPPGGSLNALGILLVQLHEIWKHEPPHGNDDHDMINAICVKKPPRELSYWLNCHGRKIGHGISTSQITRKNLERLPDDVLDDLIKEMLSENGAVGENIWAEKIKFENPKKKSPVKFNSSTKSLRTENLNAIKQQQASRKYANSAKNLKQKLIESRNEADNFEKWRIAAHETYLSKGNGIGSSASVFSFDGNDKEENLLESLDKFAPTKK